MSAISETYNRTHNILEFADILTNVSFHNKGSHNSSENSRPFWRLRFRRGSAVRPPSNGEGLRDIQHSMSMVLDTRFHI